MRSASRRARSSTRPLASALRAAGEGELDDLEAKGPKYLHPIAPLHRNAQVLRLHACAQDHIDLAHADADGVERVDPDAIFARHLRGVAFAEA
jgi:hypothetical protein